MTLTETADRDGNFAATDGELISTDPRTGAVVGRFPVAGQEAADAAIARARAAAGWWWSQGLDGRARHLLRWRGEIARGAEDLVDLIHRENGKTRDAARAELLNCLELIGWAAENAPRVLVGRDVPTPFPHLEARVEYRPYGVVGVIGPWNFPAATPMGIIAFAMAAGNAVIFKPSEVTPAVGQWLADAWARAVPDCRVFDVLIGVAATGQALITGGVDKIAFTGSVRTGRAIMRAAAEQLTPMLLELGGNDAVIVAEDADLETAAEDVVFGAFTNTGLGCVSLERAIVVEAVHDEFVRHVIEHARAIRVAEDADPQLGAIPLPAQVDTIRAHVTDALERGATAVFGDHDAMEAPFVGPIVLTGVPRDCLIAREETFGPVLAVIEVADTEEAITVANETAYGLGSAVFSGRRAADIARRVHAGMTSVNCAGAFAMVSALPFGGGAGVSGFGRKHGEEGLLEFARPHALATRVEKPALNVASFSVPAGLFEAALAHVSGQAVEQAEALDGPDGEKPRA